MAKFIVNNDFQFGGGIRRVETILTVSNQEVLKEINKGTHPVNKVPLSGLLNHCSPANAETKKLLRLKEKFFETEDYIEDIEEEDVDQEMIDKEEAEIEALREEFVKIGKSFDGRWGVPMLRDMLKKAKKETGN